MSGVITTAVVGIVCIILGISNMRGNISTLHSYHRSRVSEEDRIPFGKRVGLGTIIIGAAVMAYSALLAAALYMENEMFTLIGTGVMLVGLVVGLVIAFAAMKKYNKGIF